MEATAVAVDVGNQQMLMPLILALKTSGEKAARGFMALEERR